MHFEKAFREHNLIGGQILVGYNDFANKDTRENLRNTLKISFELGVIQVFNENDSVCTNEIAFGDNDKLSAYVSNLIDADLLLLLTDVDGVYRSTKKKDVINYVTDVQEIKEYITSNVSDLGTGGMLYYSALRIWNFRVRRVSSSFL